jgi:G3E family GTPase
MSCPGQYCRCLKTPALQWGMAVCPTDASAAAQVEFADVVLLNKCDLATTAQLQQVPVAYIAVCSCL